MKSENKPDQAGERQQRGEPGRVAAPQAALLEELDGRVEGQGEEERDEDPRQHLPREPDDQEQDREGERDHAGC